MTCPSAAAPDDGVVADEAVDPRVARSRARVLAAATELLVESGQRAVTVDAVAERSGVAKSTLYRHWPSRTALLTDVLRTNVPAIEEPDLDHGFATALRSLVMQMATVFADPEWARIMPALFSLRQQIPEVGDLQESDQEEKTAALRTVLELGAAEGVLPEGLDTELVALQLLGPLVLASIGSSQVEADELATHLVDRFLASYGAEPGVSDR